MNILSSTISVFLDVFSFLFLVVISVILAVFVRSILLFSNEQAKPIQTQKPPRKKPVHIPPKTKSIVINPDEIGRIYVKRH